MKNLYFHNISFILQALKNLQTCTQCKDFNINIRGGNINK